MGSRQPAEPGGCLDVGAMWSTVNHCMVAATMVSGPRTTVYGATLHSRPNALAMPFIWAIIIRVRRGVNLFLSALCFRGWTAAKTAHCFRGSTLT